MTADMWVFENAARHEGFSTIAGIDEAGRGPLAGPVVSAAVILPAALQIAGVDDSKRLTPKKRAALFGEIYRRAISVGVGVVGPGRIDEINILQASLKSMAMAVACLNPRPDCLLIDGIFKIESDISQTPIPKGDARSVSIAAASIIAKVTRDNMMVQYHRQYPQYGFAQHKGYPTKAHKIAIREHGCTPIHRRSFRGVREYI
ncbi:MAG: ribonuclease HII [Deltaproteobacteria bacterium]|nr:ribonuclease HII [Deltaproteobacteria bacterium]